MTMFWTRLWFWTVAIFSPVLTAALSSKYYFISAPNVIRVGVNETIVINTLNANIPVTCTVELQDYPAKLKTYASQTVNVNQNEPKTVTLQVSPQDVEDASNNPEQPQYVYLHAYSSQPTAFEFDDGAPVLLSYKAGYTFLQTDKPLYTPRDKVFIRVVAVDQQMRPSLEKVRIDVITPQGVIVKRFMVEPDAGFARASYQFPASPAFGNWTVSAYYGYKMKHNTTVQFLVKEYVLPTFSVEITVQPTSYILSSYDEITTIVRGKYVFGDKYVQGFYRIRYHLLDQDGSLQLIEDNINGTVNSGSGEAFHTLMLSDILGNQDFDDFIGKRLHIEAFIVESATGKVESSNNTVLQFVDTPYKIKWDQTRKYFKTKHPFEVKADVIYCYGDPVANLKVNFTAVGHMAGGEEHILHSEVDHTSDQGHVKVHINIDQTGLQDIVCTMTTAADDDLANFGLTDTFTVLPFNAGGDNTMKIISLQIEPDGKSGSASLDRQGEEAEDVDVIFTYIVSGGRITQAQAINIVIGNTVADIDIKPDMVPSARMVAFYVNDDNQFIADSLWIDVDDHCENPVEVSVPVGLNGYTYYMPGETATLTLSGKPHTKIGLLAVDAAVYLLQDYHRLTQKKVFARMASYDLGCGPGGGRDIQDIFKNAGITILTNAGLQTELRDDLSCDEHNRKRRSAPQYYNLQDLMNEYEGNSTLTTYCERGARIIEGWSCLRRFTGLANRKGWELDHPCVQALKKCCYAVSQAGGRSADQNPAALQVGPIDYGEVNVRSNFPESWLFEYDLVDLEEKKSLDHPIQLPGSITTWIIHAVGVSPLHGMCVADNKEIVARRPNFLDVSIPYSVMRREQVAIQATVYNYNERNQDLRVELRMYGEEGLCSNARHGEFVSKNDIVAGGSAKSFTFIVIPLEVKNYTITIHMYSSFGTDAVRKTLYVVPEGAPQVQALSTLVDPAGLAQLVPPEERVEEIDHGLLKNLKHKRRTRAAERIQKDIITLTMPEDAVPNTAECDINLIGSILGPVASTVIAGLNTGDFLHLPGGCGEQNMIYTAPNVYIYKYLKSIGKVTNETETKATQNIEDGYAHQTQNYQTPEGAFKVYNTQNHPENSWLTAFVLRVFCEAQKVTNAFVDEKNVICKGMSWLAGIQKADGSFEFTYRINSYLMGFVVEPIPLTAYVLITFSECDCVTLDTSEAMRDATTFLESKLPEIAQNSHTLAIVTYALALVNSSMAIEANTQLRTLAHNNTGQGTKYFGAQEDSVALKVETTAYALLAQIILGEISYSYPIVQWLMLQRNQIGMWYSTQDTMVALQALSEYAQRTNVEDFDMTCDITASADEKFSESWQVLPENSLILQATQAPVEGLLVFNTQGVGVATLSINLRYHKAGGNQSLCPFEVSVTPTDKDPAPLSPGVPAPERNMRRLSMEVCARYTGEGKTNMAIIDVTLLSGFKPITKTLKQAVEDTPLIQLFEVTDRNVIFYADEIPGVDALCVTFEAQQENEVGNLQPVPVQVYDYYQPERKCIEFYHPDRNSPLLETICEGFACQCAAASCGNMVPDLSITAVELKFLSCQSPEHFAYKTYCTRKGDWKTFDIFTMNVTDALKPGKEQDVQTAQFWKSVNCPHPEMEEGQEYLIVGNGGIPVINEINGDITMYKHFVDSGFTIIHWPSDTQLRQAVNACFKKCSNKPCKKQCFQTHRKPWRDYFTTVEEEFQTGCPS
ncbi:complement C3-like [Amphiura filiformis]|uniref:complement C3-like n=1 Tax=Amphiura filiformis TaxID=82378 RepID=UPI003B21C6EE